MPEISFFESRLNDICGSDSVKKSVPMSEHTTFRTGGPADYYVIPKDRETFLQLIRYMKQSEREYFILGKGSNILVGDKGYRGTVVDTSEALKDVVIEEEMITAGAGAYLAAVANMAADASLTGMEFASGIPGSIGGAVFMNAGAYGGEMSMIVSSVEVIEPSGEVINILGSEMGFGYRTSVAQREGFAVISAELRLQKGSREEIYAKIKDLGMQRAKKQPLDFPSAGSTFKRPEGYFAAKLITDTGLSGLTIGGARVSPKHNGFIINLGNATSADILDLIEEVRERVKAKFGVELEPEVRIIGNF
ncbi:MAG: UDP-N-acetylmuramate dehydrogenase [Lachnospiraceae bacterium]|nr:UDP-N-acetylmuramate dehydrogenase [Lachnospiraceae bacterium]